MDSIFYRRSIRKYKTTPIEPEKIELLLKAAMYAPSAHNKQPWHFIVCDDKEVLEEIRNKHPYASMLSTAPVCIVVLGDTKEECAPGYFMIDCSAAIQNILLCAHEQGLGTCWLGVTPRSERMGDFSELFNLPEHIKVHSMIAVGYPDEHKEKPDRFNPNKIHKNRW